MNNNIIKEKADHWVNSCVQLSEHTSTEYSDLTESLTTLISSFLFSADTMLAVAEKTTVDGHEVIALNGDGVMLSADNASPCAFGLTEGKKYQVNVFEVEDESALSLKDKLTPAFNAIKDEISWSLTVTKYIAMANYVDANLTLSFNDTDQCLDVTMNDPDNSTLEITPDMDFTTILGWVEGKYNQLNLSGSYNTFNDAALTVASWHKILTIYQNHFKTSPQAKAS